MPIFDQGYQHWIGKHSGHTWRWLVVTRQGVRAVLKYRYFWILLLLAWMPALALVTTISGWGLIEQRSETVLKLATDMLPPGLVASPAEYRSAVWTILFQFFFKIELMFAMFLVLAIGPSLISQDLRFNALPLYFSRPLTRFDYFLGKLGVIGAFLAATTMLPATAAYLLGVAFSMDLGVIWDTHRLLWGGAIYGAVITLSSGTAMLALSAITRRSLLVALAWAAFCFFSLMLSGVLLGIEMRHSHDNIAQQSHEERMQAINNDWRRVVSYTTNLDRVGDWLLNTDRAWVTFGRAVSESRALVGSAVNRRSGGLFGGGIAEPADERLLADTMVLQYPVSWSLGILAGLWLLSALFLSSRVKSLDRLK